MAGSTKRVYWDACSWIALIHKEKIRNAQDVITEDRETMCKAVLHQARAKPQLVELVTSSLSLVEVCKHPKSQSTKTEDLAAFFEHDYILLVDLDRFSAEKARELMQAGYAGLKPPDAIHLAAALIANVEEMHTFDGALLRLNGVLNKTDGTKLKIVKPDTSVPAPLLEEAAKSASVSAGVVAPAPAQMQQTIAHPVEKLIDRNTEIAEGAIRKLIVDEGATVATPDPGPLQVSAVVHPTVSTVDNTTTTGGFNDNSANDKIDREDAE
jgi:predicted nucleic acid-binding protein